SHPRCKGPIMRTPLLLGWLMVPILAGAYHYGPGQEKLRLDDVSATLASAERHAAGQRWQEAGEDYDRALAQLPADRAAEARRVRLERDKARMFAKQLPEASADLDALVAEVQGDAKADPATLADAREALANARYYMTWLMRLEGFPREEW